MCVPRRKHLLRLVLGGKISKYLNKVSNFPEFESPSMWQSRSDITEHPGSCQINNLYQVRKYHSNFAVRIWLRPALK